MKRFWKLLNSRKFAVYLLFILLIVLVASTFLPNEFTISEEEWIDMQMEKPFVYWLSSQFSTPSIVRTPLFLILSVFLFLSTLACTLTRVSKWMRLRKAEFEKEKAFSFSVEKNSSDSVETLKKNFLSRLERKRWTCSVSVESSTVVVEAQKGSGLGFWGSVIFHIGLIACFIAAPVTAFTVFRGDFLITEGETVLLKDGIISHEGRSTSLLPNLNVTVNELKGVYAQGIYQVDFGGLMTVDGKEFRFSVNDPVDVGGYQFSLAQFGYSTGVVIEKEGAVIFDYLLNLRHTTKGDYFDLSSENLTLFALFFPDFYRDGGKIRSRTNDPRNPVLLLRFLSGEEEISKGLIRLGEKVVVGDYSVTFVELRNWASFVVVREWGVPVIAAGLVIGLVGLFVRFLSNERRLELTLREISQGTVIVLRGYSRYYPAFLEKEVRTIADRLTRNE